MTTVVLHLDQDGNPSLLGPHGVRLIWIDERSQNDRVYEQQTRATPDQIEGLIMSPDYTPNLTLNQKQAVAARLCPHLKLVEN